MVQVEGGDNGQERGEDIRCVQSSSQANFNNGNIHFLSGEIEETQACHDLKGS